MQSSEAFIRLAGSIILIFYPLQEIESFLAKKTICDLKSQIDLNHTLIRLPL